MKKKLLPLSLLFFLGIVWGSGFAIIKIILISIGPLLIMFSRIALGSLVLLIWVYLQNKSLTFDVNVPTSWCQSPVFLIDDIECLAEVVRPNTLRCTVEISNETRLHFGKK